VRFITFDKNGVEAVGARLGPELVDLSVAAPDLPRTLLGLIQAGALDEAATLAKASGPTARRPVEGIRYLPLIPRPPKFVGFGINYGSHVGERPKTPGFFISVPTRFIAHGEAMVVPKLSKTLDYENELALVIGKGGKHISANAALDHIAGYTIFHDGSVRGLGGGNTLALMKNSDRTGPMGPELVTPDELPPGCEGLKLTTRRNGVVVQHDTTSNMFWKVPEIIELTSSYMSLEAGDVITSGTCGGTVVELAVAQQRAFTDESLPWLQPGEVIECEIEGIGVLRNTVIAEVAS
jgi:2-keto-4-pentenoate hydratase/2-oxohepta-3-ene-1,7-dioic acid hydratase in catechol pathway